MIETNKLTSQTISGTGPGNCGPTATGAATEGREAPFTEFRSTPAEGLILFLAVLDVSQLRRLEAYIAPELLHRLSTDLRGLPVFLSNSSGLRYVIPLSPQPHMLKVVNLPGTRVGMY